MIKQNLRESFGSAIEGFIYVLKTQRNMRLHFLFAALIIILSFLVNPERSERLALVISICLVLLTEMLNTAVELAIDMISDKFHPIARIVKDVCAGCVLIATINAFVVGYFVFIRDDISLKIMQGVLKIRQSPWHLTLISLIAVMSLVIFGKIFFHKGTPLRGGMPSGHSAFAFSLWTIVTFVAKDYVASPTIFCIISTLVLCLAFLIARSRWKDSIHTIGEIIAGSLLGILVTTLIFQLLK
jgi:diacylglycerol kinase (ATP)